jgi:hypothetical protein
MAGESAPLQLFGDFGFVGGEDTAPNPLQNNQTCINWYAEVDKQNAKEVVGLLGCPGLMQLVAAPGGGSPGGPITVVIDTHPLVKIWENDATAFPFQTLGSPGPYPIATAFVAGTVRVNGWTRGPETLLPTTYRLSLATGAVLPTDIPNTVESLLRSGGAGFLDPGSNQMGQVMQQAQGLGGIYGHNPGGSAGTSNQIVSHQSNVGNAQLYGFKFTGSSGGVINSDVLAALTAPPSGNWYLEAHFPCADMAHIWVITSDNSTNRWAHLCSVDPLGITAEVARYSFASVSDCDTYLNPTVGVRTWWASTGFGAGAPPAGMGESDLVHFWSIGSNVARFAIVSNVATLLGHITAISSVPPGGTMWADGGSAVQVSAQAAACWSVGGTTIQQWPPPSAVTNLPVRGLWELPNDQTALAVIGNTCYLVTVATPATASTFPTLALTSVGTLLTNIGQVRIRDNNIGGYAVIVDGPYGYLYNIATRAFSQITDPAFLGADTVAFIDGWWIFNQPGTQTFYTNGVQYGITFNGTNFALKDSSADNLVAVMENKEQLWLIGDKTTEIWYDAGGQYFAFQRLVGTPIQAGCKAKYSVARFGTEGLIWFGRSERGENVILLSSGFAVNVVSTPAFGTEVAQYPITSDAIAYTYQEDTHEFYVLTFPTADVTWCYDSQSQLLHKRPSYDPYLQKFHRHRSNAFMNFQGMRIVGDYQCGSLYQLTRNAFTDSGWPILAKRRSPHIWDKGQRGRVFMASLQLDFVPGVGNASGLGSNPQASIAISRDGGKTFGQRWSAPIGQIGQYKNRTMWRKLSFGRDNVVDLEVIDPVKRDLIGVTLRAFSA